MPRIDIPSETIARLDTVREDEEAYDELIGELLNIYEASEGAIERRSDWL